MYGNDQMLCVKVLDVNVNDTHMSVVPFHIAGIKFPQSVQSSSAGAVWRVT